MICDKIDFSLRLDYEVDTDRTNYMVLESTLLVNDILFKGYLDFFAFFKNTHLVHSKSENKNFEWYGAEYLQYNRSTKRYDGIVSPVYFETCSCGAPGCNDIFNGVRVYKKKKYFKYVVLKKDGYDDGLFGTGKFNLTFSKEDIFSIRKKIIEFFINNSKNPKFKEHFIHDINQCIDYQNMKNLYE